MRLLCCDRLLDLYLFRVEWRILRINLWIPSGEYVAKSLQWRHNGRDNVSNPQLHDCLLNLLFRRRSKKTSKLRITGLCAGNSPGTGEFPAQMASYAEKCFHLMTSSWCFVNYFDRISILAERFFWIEYQINRWYKNSWLIEEIMWGVGTNYNDMQIPNIHGPGARLTKAYDVTIQRYRNSHAKIRDSKMHVLRCMGLKFCVKFQMCPLKFHTKFWTHTPQNMHLRGVKNLTTYDILELWYLKS